LELAGIMLPGIKTIAIPPGLYAMRGGEAVVDFLKEQIIGFDLTTHT
jgi:hypothetical protein